MKVDKNIKIPALSSRGGRPVVYPYKTMDVGDSFFVYGQKPGGGAYQAVKIYGKKTGKSFVGRTVDGGVRIWRVR